MGLVLAPTQDVDHLGNEACVLRDKHHLQEAFVCDDHTLGNSSTPSVVSPAGALVVVVVPVAVVVAGAAAVALVAAAL